MHEDAAAAAYVAAAADVAAAAAVYNDDDNDIAAFIPRSNRLHSFRSASTIMTCRHIYKPVTARAQTSSACGLPVPSN